MLALTLTVMPASVAEARGGNTFLTGPKAGDALDIALAYLRAHPGKYGITGSDLRDIVVTDRYKDAHNGVTHIYLRQRFKGIEIVGSDVNVSVTRDGRDRPEQQLRRQHRRQGQRRQGDPQLRKRGQGRRPQRPG